MSVLTLRARLSHVLPLRCLAQRSLALYVKKHAPRLDAKASLPPALQRFGSSYTFSSDGFRSPDLPLGLAVRDVPLKLATDESLVGLGCLVHDPDAFTCEKRTFEIVRWPQPGWRSLDPGTGDEAGTTEGDFEVWWEGDFFYGRNHAIATANNTYLDGLGAPPEQARKQGEEHRRSEEAIYLWMTDYHPDGGQLFWPRQPVPFVVCLGPAAKGDAIQPEDMCAFAIPPGKGLYIHPGTWHNGFYVHPDETRDGPLTVLTRQGRVHARISVSWAHEFGTLLRVPLRR